MSARVNWKTFKMEQKVPAGCKRVPLAEQKSEAEKRIRIISEQIGQNKDILAETVYFMHTGSREQKARQWQTFLSLVKRLWNISKMVYLDREKQER